MDEPSLTGCLAKLDRADEHFRTLDAEIPPFLESQPHRFSDELDRETGRWVIRVNIRREPPLGWSVIVGDFVHNLRSALDHLVWQLVLLSGNTPIGGPRGNQFPILTTKPRDLRTRSNSFNTPLRGVHRGLRAVIRQLQPFHGRGDPKLKPLAVLADLSNEDKHQATLPGVAAIPPHLLTEEELDFRPIAMNDVALIERFEVYANRPIEDGSEIVSAQLTITGPDPQVGVDGRLPFDVAFGRGMVPMRGLVEIRRAVRSVIEPMQRIFPSGS